MIVEYIRYQVVPEQREALVAAYQQAAAQLDAAPECLRYELSECEEEAGNFILRIEWESTQAHLQGFRPGPHFAAFFAAVRGFYASIQEMRHYRPTAVSRAS
ncbi:MAG: antibiotic biosynthesis monooxygenase [Ferruginibacter sp.]|nr:antibiotic biosynthesis monooxygenase [Cytophagales bacterium]